MEYSNIGQTGDNVPGIFKNSIGDSAMQNKSLKSPARQLVVPNTASASIRPKEDRHFVTALARGLDVLSAFRSRDRILGNQELARRCGLPKSTISRLTYTLTRQGYLEPASDGKGAGGYRLGSAVLALGGAMLARVDMRQLARPLMQELADSSQAMVSLGIRDRLSMIYVENCRSESALTLSLDVGSRVPLATSAMGRAYLACCSDGERSELMAQLRSHDEKAWPGVRATIERALAHYREHGCSSSFGEWQKDVNAIGVAFQPAGGRSLMVISCGGPGVSNSPEFLMNEARPRLLALVRELQGDSAAVL
jgi:DNA-binding IclR family transcriptional regulator